MKKNNSFTAVFFLLSTLLAAQAADADPTAPAGVKIGLYGGGSLPLGTSAAFYSAGYFADFSGNLPLNSSLGLNLGLGYAGLPLIAGPRIDLGRAELGASYVLPLGNLLSLKGTLGAGGFFGALSDGSGLPADSATSSAGPCASADVSFSFLGVRNLDLTLGLRYRNLFGLWSGLEGGISASIKLEPRRSALAAATRVLPLGSDGLVVDTIQFGNVFPVFFKYYNDYSFGSAMLTNNEKDAVTDVSVSLFMRQYMDAPKICAVIPRLERGEKSEVGFLALFTDKMLEITEGTMVSADIGVTYSLKGQQVQKSGSEAVRILDRNAMTWLDDRCAAAYITAKDPSILSFAKNVAGSIKSVMNLSVNKNLQTALALHEALDLYGMNYVVDPKSSYSSGSANKEAVDFLQFPRQTLEYRAGDCDDLTILYTALLESVGIETALLTVPGHIYAAFYLDVSADDARKVFSRPDDLIIRDGKVWLPVEITDRKGGFLAAWQTGAKEWREADARKQAGLFPVHEAWTVFEPVGLPGVPPAFSFPEPDAVLTRYQSETTRFIERELVPLTAKIQAEISRTNGAPKAINSLGVLYARFGLYDKAEVEFKKNIVKLEYVPSLLNLGNIQSLKNKRDAASGYFERAYRAEPRNALAVLYLAKINHEAENYGLVKKLYAELALLDSALAAQYAWLDLKGAEAARASDVSRSKEQLLWSE